MKAPARVLIVEDEATIAIAICRTLEDRGYEVVIASSAEEALDVPAADVLVCDLTLDVLSGLDLLTSLQERGESPRTVFMTGMPTIEDCRRALQLGASDFLTKPFRLEDLVRAIEGEPAGAPLPKSVEKKPMAGHFQREYVPMLGAVEACARDMVAFAVRCGISPAGRARIGSAISEVIENAVVHAYEDTRGKTGRIVVEANVDDREMIVLVSDDGCGFDPALASNAFAPEEWTSGLGRAAALAEDITITPSPEGGTDVQVTFSAYRVHFDEEDCVDLTELDFFTPETSRQVLRALHEEGAEDLFHLSPALAVIVGRLLQAPDPRQVLLSAKRSS